MFNYYCYYYTNQELLFKMNIISIFYTEFSSALISIVFNEISLIILILADLQTVECINVTSGFLFLTNCGCN